MAAVSSSLYSLLHAGSDGISAVLPSYSSIPHPQEQTLEYSSVHPPRGNVTRKLKQATLILRDVEEDGDGAPIYTRKNALIYGELEVSADDSIRLVTAKLEGKLEMSISDGGVAEVLVASEKEILWQEQESSSQRCPTILPFSIPFPTSYEVDGRMHRIPPSYEMVYYGAPTLCVQSSYHLHLTVSKKHSKLGFWKPQKTYSIPVRYRPRTRPSRPIHPSMISLFSSLKPLTEEWHQIVTQINPKPNSDLESIHTQFLIPSVQTFGLRDSIPFHIQLTGPLASIKHFLPPNEDGTNSLCSSARSSGSGSSHSSSSKRSLSSYSSVAPTLRVFLARQILVEINGKKSWRNSTIGEGNVRPIPPPPSTSSSSSSRREIPLDWEGEVKCRDEVQCVGFKSGNLMVKDFIVLSLTPPNPKSSPLLQLQHAHPIKFATDTWTDTHGAHPLDHQ